MGVGQGCNLHRFATAQGAREQRLERGGIESLRYFREEHPWQREQPVKTLRWEHIWCVSGKTDQCLWKSMWAGRGVRLGLERECGQGGRSYKDYGFSSEGNLEPLKGFELRLVVSGLAFIIFYSHFLFIFCAYRCWPKGDGSDRVQLISACAISGLQRVGRAVHSQTGQLRDNVEEEVAKKGDSWLTCSSGFLWLSQWMCCSVPFSPHTLPGNLWSSWNFMWKSRYSSNCFQGALANTLDFYLILSKRKITVKVKLRLVVHEIIK